MTCKRSRNDRHQVFIRASIALAVASLLPTVTGCATTAANADPGQTPLATSDVFEVTPAKAPTMVPGYFDDPVAGLKAVQMELRDGFLLIEGDIVIGSRDEASNPARAKGLTDVRAKLWPKGKVYYDLPAEFPDREAVENAIGEYNQRTKIHFIPKQPATKHYVKFTVTDNPNVGGQSHLGRKGGEQELWMNANTAKWSTGTVIHELGHALGLMHEQCRSDRDEFVEVIWENVIEGYRSQFDQLYANGKDLRSYDYGSIMHYPSTAFGVNGAVTIKALKPEVQFGQRVRLSDGDIASLAALYAEELQP
jgi:hypothetical protein